MFGTVHIVGLFALFAIALAQEGDMVRQCTCAELDDCMEDMKAEGQKCGDSCWQIATEITPHPEQLRQCFEQKTGEVDKFVDCFQDEYRGCSKDRNGPMIQRQSMEGVIEATESKIRNTAKTLAVPGLTGKLSNVIKTAEHFGACVKRCVRRRAIGTVCLRKFNCQPLLPSEMMAKKINNMCTRGINFKQEAGPLCNCALRAGVSDLEQYCPILALMGNRQH